MFSFRKPSEESLRRIIAEQRALDFTYASVGATNDGQMPSGFNVDVTRVEIGRGAEAFERARAALKRWEQFRLGWLEAFPDDTRLRPGETVVVVARAFGSWSTNAARIVYTIDDEISSPDPDGSTRVSKRFGFAYGTLPGHVESGEERFLVEWDQTTDQVWYNILAFSRPRHILSRLGYPFARALQKRFARQSAAAMQRAVDSAS